MARLKGRKLFSGLLLAVLALAVGVGVSRCSCGRTAPGSEAEARSDVAGLAEASRQRPVAVRAAESSAPVSRSAAAGSSPDAPIPTRGTPEYEAWLNSPWPEYDEYATDEEEAAFADDMASGAELVDDGPDNPDDGNLTGPTRLSRRVAELLEGDQPEAIARQLLASDDALLRLVGAAVLARLGSVSAAELAALAADADLGVALAAGEWFRDYAGAEAWAVYRKELDARGETPESLMAFLGGEATFYGGGRLAAELLAAAPEGLERMPDLVADSGLAYDTRMRALQLWRAAAEPEDFDNELADIVVDAGAQAREDDAAEPWAEAMEFYNDRAHGDDGETLVTDSTLTRGELVFLVANTYVYTARDLALLMEWTLLTQARIEAGASRLIASYLAAAREPEGDWDVEAEEPLDRIEAMLPRIRELEEPLAPEETAQISAAPARPPELMLDDGEDEDWDVSYDAILGLGEVCEEAE